jgi:hypothetical protein
MEKVKLITRALGGFAFQAFEGEINRWLADYQDKEVLDIVFQVFPPEPPAPVPPGARRVSPPGDAGYLIALIRYKE